MAGARRRGEWAQTLAMLAPLCFLVNAKLRKGATPWRPSDFDPSKPRKPATPKGVPVTPKDLVALFVKKP